MHHIAYQRSDRESNAPRYVVVPGIYEEREVIEGTSVYITSPNYPNNYAANSLYNWVLTAPANERIELVFKFFRLDERADKLQVCPYGL